MIDLTASSTFQFAAARREEEHKLNLEDTIGGFGRSGSLRQSILWSTVLLLEVNALLCFGCFLLLVVPSTSLISMLFLLCFPSVSSVVVSDLPVGPFLKLPKHSAISLLGSGALSTLVTPAGDSARHVVLFVLLHCQLSSVISFYSLPVSLSLKLSMISAIYLISGGALSTLVSTVGVSSHHVLFLPFYYQSSSVYTYPVSLSLMSSRISVLSPLNGGALSTLVSTVGEPSRHFFGFLLSIFFNYVLFLFHQSACLLRLSRISAISLYGGGALSTLVTPASGYVTVSLPLTTYIPNFCYCLHFCLISS